MQMVGIASIARQIACAAVAIGITTGCSSDDSDGGTTPSVTETEQIEFLNPYTQPGDAQALQALLNLHREKHPNVRITNTALPVLELFAQLQSRSTEGEPFDAFAWVAQGITSFNPRPLDDFMAAHPDILENLYPELLEAVTVDGKIYALPWNTIHSNTLFYSKRVFSELNLDPPTTIDELRAVSEAIKAEGVFPLGAPFLNYLLESLLVGSVGIDSYYDYVNGNADEAAFRNAMEVVEEVVDNYLSPPSSVDPGVAEQPEIRAFVNGEIAMLIDADPTQSNLEELGWTPGVDFGMLPAPGNQGLVSHVVIALAASDDSPNTQGALDFLETAASVEGHNAFDTARRAISARKDVDESQFDPERRILIRETKQAKYRVATLTLEWEEAMRAFIASDPHDKEALLQVVLETSHAAE